jgi:hypothetical protein
MPLVQSQHHSDQYGPSELPRERWAPQAEPSLLAQLKQQEHRGLIIQPATVIAVAQRHARAARAEQATWYFLATFR